MDGDLDLLERWRGGDQSAGQELFKRHFQSIYRFFDNKCRGEADELVQRTFFQCLRARDQFRGASTFRTFLFAIARHELYQHLRELRRDERLEFGTISIAELASSLGTRLDLARRVERLQAAMRTLPVEQQLLLELNYWHDLDSPALAEIFEMPAATVRTKIFRARKALRAQLENVELDASDRLVASLSAIEEE